LRGCGQVRLWSSLQIFKNIIISNKTDFVKEFYKIQAFRFLGSGMGAFSRSSGNRQEFFFGKSLFRPSLCVSPDEPAQRMKVLIGEEVSMRFRDIQKFFPGCGSRNRCFNGSFVMTSFRKR